MNSSGFSALDPAVQKAMLAALDHHATDDLFLQGLEWLPQEPFSTARPQNEQIDEVRNLDQFASSDIYRGSDGGPFGIGAKHVSDDDKRVFLLMLREDPSITLDSLKGRDDITADELEMQVNVHDGLNDPAAVAAFDKLVRSDDFKHLKPDTRVAVLSQVKNYPDDRSIENLEHLTGRSWFQDASLGDQQRSAKIIAFASQDPTGDATITNNALHSVLTNDHLNVQWGEPSTAGNGGPDKFLGLFWETGGSTINLRRDYIPDGNGSLDGNPSAKFMSEYVLAHEANHVLNRDEVGQSYRYFMAEYRAWYVGYEASNGRPPSQQECFDQAQSLVKSTTDPYGEIHNAFTNMGSDESNKIVRFMARIIGADPAHATNTSVLHPGSLSTTDVGLAPEAANRDDPNNLDDHS